MLVLTMENKKEKTISKIIQDNIKKYRDEKKMTQKELGLAMGYDEETAQQRISQYEKGSRSPNKETLQQMAKLFGKPVEAFMIENYEMFEMIKNAFKGNKQQKA